MKKHTNKRELMRHVGVVWKYYFSKKINVPQRVKSPGFRNLARNLHSKNNFEYDNTRVRRRTTEGVSLSHSHPFVGTNHSPMDNRRMNIESYLHLFFSFFEEAFVIVEGWLLSSARLSILRVK